jgi:hypothetical protein
MPGCYAGNNLFMIGNVIVEITDELEARLLISNVLGKLSLACVSVGVRVRIIYVCV